MIRNLFIALTIIFGSLSVKAEVIQQGTNFTQISEKKSDKLTFFTYTDKDGKVYPIYQSKNNSFYIIKISKKTGKEYKYYLPKEVQEKIRMQLQS